MSDATAKDIEQDQAIKGLLEVVAGLQKRLDGLEARLAPYAHLDELIQRLRAGK